MKRPDDARLGPVPVRSPSPVTPPPRRESSGRAATVSGGVSREPRVRVRDDRQAGTKNTSQQPKRTRTKRPESETARTRREMRAAIAARKTAERNEIRRFTAHVRRRRQALLAILASAGALAAFVAVGTFTPVMALQTVTVVGTQRVDPQIISAGVAEQLGKPLPLIDSNSIRDVIALQPLVKSFAIEAKPPHELVIHITERVPAGYLMGRNGFTLVDAAGVTIERSAERTLTVPVIDVTGASPTAKGFPAAMAVLQALPESIRNQVDRVAASTTDDVTLFLNPTGSRVIWGGPENSALKARVLTALIANYPLGSVTAYDVSAPNSAVVS